MVSVVYTLEKNCKCGLESFMITLHNFSPYYDYWCFPVAYVSAHRKFTICIKFFILVWCLFECTCLLTLEENEMKSCNLYWKKYTVITCPSRFLYFNSLPRRLHTYKLTFFKYVIIPVYNLHNNKNKVQGAAA